MFGVCVPENSSLQRTCISPEPTNLHHMFFFSSPMFSKILPNHHCKNQTKQLITFHKFSLDSPGSLSRSEQNSEKSEFTRLLSFFH